MKKIVFLIASNTTKGEILISEISQNNNLNKFDIVFCLDSPEGLNIDLLEKIGYSYLVGGKSADILLETDYDYLISCGWGYKISNTLIHKAKVAAINCHSSLLPDYKGGSAYEHYWANFELEAGTSIHFLTEKFDAGNIICTASFPCGFWCTPKGILTKISHQTYDLLVKAIYLFESGEEVVGRPTSRGRYFFKCSRKKLILHRIVNSVFFCFGLSYRWLTPHKLAK